MQTALQETKGILLLRGTTLVRSRERTFGISGKISGTSSPFDFERIAPAMFIIKKASVIKTEAASNHLIT